MAYSLTFEPQATSNELRILSNGISDQAYKIKNMPPFDFFAFFIRDSSKKIMGGCCGCTLYGSLYIDQLWVDESLRKQGYGTQLMHAAEQHGKEIKCSFITVNTMDWEALEFYKKLGFYIEFERHGFLKDSVFYFLRKNLVVG